MWFAVDVTLTLCGQPESYWAGDRFSVLEANPIAMVILTQGPEVFVTLSLFWVLILIYVTLCVSHPMVPAIVVVVGSLHIIGGCTWLIRLEPWGWIYAIGYAFLTREGSSWCWRRSLGEPTK